MEGWIKDKDGNEIPSIIKKTDSYIDPRDGKISYGYDIFPMHNHQAHNDMINEVADNYKDGEVIFKAVKPIPDFITIDGGKIVAHEIELFENFIKIRVKEKLKAYREQQTNKYSKVRFYVKDKLYSEVQL